jgi:hypothetical protein
MPRRLGYGILETLRGRNAKDNAYGAVMQAHNSAEAHDRRDEMVYDQTLAEYAERAYEAVGGSAELQLLTGVAFPVVVADGRMFECYLGDDGQVRLSETTMGAVCVPSKHRPDPWTTIAYDSVVRVVTEDFVKPLAAQAKQALDALLCREEAVREVWEYELSRLVLEQEDEIPF